MSDMLRYFKKERDFLRKVAHEFSLKYPKVAGHLNFGAHDSGDPQVERLLEAFAFLTGNIQMLIDSQFSGVTTALLNILYPSLVSPIPSMSIAKFEIGPDEVPAGGESIIPKHTKLFAEATNGEACYFRTCYPIKLMAVEVGYAGFESLTKYDFLGQIPGIGAVLRINVKALGEAVFSEFNLDTLRLYINGDSMLASDLYEAILCNLVKVAILPEDKPDDPIFLSNDSIEPVGFKPGEEVIPADENGHPAYHFMMEYFCFPEKFYFIDINNLDKHQSETSFDILIMLSDNPGLNIDRDTFLTFCSPIINLFENKTAVFKIDHKKSEYHVVPDPYKEDIIEVHSIINVNKTFDHTIKEQKIEPFYSFKHELLEKAQQSYWYTRREESWRKGFSGTELYMSFRNLDFENSFPETETVYVHSLCTNRDLANSIPANALLEPEEKADVERIVCLKKPTKPVTPPLRGATLWNLISNLSLNYLSLSEGKESLDSLRSILRSYNFTDSVVVEQQIMGLRELKCRQTLNQTGFEGWRGFCKGLEITLLFDSAFYVGSSAYLLGAVLNQFFSLYVGVNSFTETVLKRTTDEGEWKRWAPVTGKKTVL